MTKSKHYVCYDCVYPCVLRADHNEEDFTYAPDEPRACVFGVTDVAHWTEFLEPQIVKKANAKRSLKKTILKKGRTP